MSRRHHVRRVDKYDLVPGIVAATRARSVLDVGCRNNVLHRRMLEIDPELKDVRYAGADLFQNEDEGVDFVGDFTKGIPVEDHSFDLVAAFDVLEHVDDLQGGLDELDRIAAKAIAVTLPNVAHAFFRAQFLRRGELAAKYDLRYGYGLDRHRWVTVLSQTDAFVAAYAADHGFHLDQTYLTGAGGWKLRALQAALERMHAPPAWWVWTAVYVLTRRS